MALLTLLTSLVILAVFCIATTLAESPECSDQPHANDEIQLLQVVLPILNKSDSTVVPQLVQNGTNSDGITSDSLCWEVRKGQSICLARQQSYCLGVLFVYALFTLLYQVMVWIYVAADSVDEDRDPSWDLVKLWFMLGVLWIHTSRSVVTSECKAWVLIQFFQRSTMSGFSFVSGIFSASYVVYEKADGKLVIHGSRCARCFRDYVLPCITMSPFFWIAPLFHIDANGVEPQWRAFASKFAKTPLLPFPPHYVYWYLVCLYLWTMLVPLMCMLRWPVTISLFVAVACRSSFASDASSDASRSQITLMFHDEDFFYFLPFFVVGFVLAGGGESAEGRANSRSHLVNCLTDTRVRVASVIFFVTGCICCETSLISNATIGSAYFAGPAFNRKVVPWIYGGLLADVVSHMFLLLLNLIAIVLCFMVPACSFLSTIGSRSLYIYLAHILVTEPLQSTMQLLFKPMDCNVRVVACSLYVVALALVLGSDLTKRLIHHFVQPQWLASLLLVPFKGSRK